MAPSPDHASRVARSGIDDSILVFPEETFYFDWLENKRKFHAAEAALKNWQALATAMSAQPSPSRSGRGPAPAPP